MRYKRQFYGSLTITLLLLVIMGSVIIYIDPFYHYHAPLHTFRYRPNMNLHSYTNPGVAKHYAYDTVVLGSSMTRTFSATYANQEYGWNVVKLSIPEARGRDIREMYEQIDEHTQRVIIGLDMFAYQVGVEEEANEKPVYLWNKNPFDDVSYIWNKKVFLDNVGQVLRDTMQNRSSYTMDEYQNWEEVRKIEPGSLLQWALQYQATEQFLDGTYDEHTIQENIDKNLVSIIKEHPQQEFILYFPPYSIFYWMRSLETNKLAEEIKEIQMITESVLPYDNVKLYFPMGDASMITDHTHYLDYLHYDTEISNRIIKSFQEPDLQMTKANYQERLHDFAQYLEDFPYRKFAEEQSNAM